MNEGIERQLIEFAKSAKPTGEAAWFNFDRLTFETDSATIRMSESREQLQNIVEILKAYPTMRIKLGRYADNTGDEVHNVQLSKARAEATEKALVSMGIDASRLDVEGYGSQNPVASNDTEEGRARNRRVAVSVVQR